MHTWIAYKLHTYRPQIDRQTHKHTNRGELCKMGEKKYIPTHVYRDTYLSTESIYKHTCE